MEAKEIIARRAAQEIRDGDYVNLGVGLPTLVPRYVRPEIQVVFHSENGVLGVGGYPSPDQIDPDLINAGKQPIAVVPGAAFFDSVESFALIRGGHLDLCILGAMEVSESGDVANWTVPGRKITGMGGAMDLVSGAEKVVIAMTHQTREGGMKIRRRCTLPLTGIGCAQTIITELALIRVGPQGLLLKELFPGVSVDDARSRTDADLDVAADLKIMELEEPSFRLTPERIQG